MLAGTTGYDFLNSVGGLFVDPAGLAELTNIYGRFIDQSFEFREVAYESKQLILRTAMSSDLQLLPHRLNRISERHRRSRDFTLNTLRMALREILACFPVTAPTSTKAMFRIAIGRFSAARWRRRSGGTPPPMPPSSTSSAT